jgi:hypothetical protein
MAAATAIGLRRLMIKNQRHGEAPDPGPVVDVLERGCPRASDASVPALPTSAAELTGCAFSPDQTRIAIASMNGRIELWDVEALEMVAELEVLGASGGRIEGFAFSPDSRWLACASGQGYQSGCGERIPERLSGLLPTTPAMAARSHQPAIAWLPH